jgi:hypothetical protein
MRPRTIATTSLHHPGRTPPLKRAAPVRFEEEGCLTAVLVRVTGVAVRDPAVERLDKREPGFHPGHFCSHKAFPL